MYLSESDSEDGPLLNENDMIDFNGEDNEDKNVSEELDNDKDKEEGTKPLEDSTVGNDTEKEDNEEDETSKDTGSWGTFD